MEKKYYSKYESSSSSYTDNNKNEFLGRKRFDTNSNEYSNSHSHSHTPNNNRDRNTNHSKYDYESKIYLIKN